MNKRASLLDAIASAYSGILLREEQAEILDAILAELRKPTRKQTMAAEKMGAGEAWAEDCWTAMIDAIGEET